MSSVKEYHGEFNGKGLKIGIVVSRFNELITRNLLSGAIDGLKRHGVDQDKVTIAWVPGACEIPLIAKKMALSNHFDAIICLGAVIRGATAHFDYVAGNAASGIASASMESNLPIIFGVLTTDTIDQALERSGSKSGNKGFDSALAAIEMANLLKKLG